MLRLAYLVSHPIQYQAPLLRRLAQEPDIDLTVLFGSDFSARGYQDPGFGTTVAWDVPLLEGYRYRVLPALRDNGTVSATTPLSRSLLHALRTPAGQPAFDALWVHGYASLNSLRAIAAAFLLGIPVLLRAESWVGDRPRTRFKNFAKRLFFRLLRPAITATLPIGSRNSAYWQAAFGAAVPSFPVPYAVNNLFFRQETASKRSERTRLRTQFQLEPARPVILFAAKLQPRKRAADLIEAVSRLSTHPYLLLAGDGEQRAELEQLAQTKQLTNIRFLGFRNQTELPTLFALADVFVLPSTHEPWGLIVNEALAAGCPVIASSDVGSAPDLIHPGINGLIYPTGNIPALAESLTQILHTPETAQTMGKSATALIANWDFEADIRGLRQALAFATHRLKPLQTEQCQLKPKCASST